MTTVVVATGVILTVLILAALAGLFSLHFRRRRLQRIMGAILRVEQQKAARAKAEHAMASALLELDALRRRTNETGSR